MSAVLSPVLSSSRRSAGPAGWIIPALTRAAGAAALAEGARLGEFEVVHLRETEARCEVYSVRRGERSYTARVARRGALRARPGLAASFGSAARVLGGVRHPNLLAVLDAGWTEEAEERPFLIHPRVVGRDLASYQVRHGPCASMCLTVAAQGAAGLSALHSAGLAHGDLGPGDLVLVAEAGEAPRIVLGGFEGGRAIRPGARAQEEPLVAADLAALGAILLGLARGLRGASLPAGYFRLAARLAGEHPDAPIGSAEEAREEAAALVATCDPGSSAASLAAAAALAESPRTSATASSSARWGEPRTTRPFGQVSLVMSRPGGARRSRVGPVAWALFVIALLVGTHAAGLAARPTVVPGAPTAAREVASVSAAEVEAQPAAEEAPLPSVPASSPVRAEAAPQPIAPVPSPARVEAATSGPSSPCTPTARKQAPQRTRVRPTPAPRRDPPAAAPPPNLPGVLDPAEPRAAPEEPASPALPPGEDELLPVRVAPKGASEGLLVAPADEPRPPVADLLPT